MKIFRLVLFVVLIVLLYGKCNCGDSAPSGMGNNATASVIIASPLTEELNLDGNLNEPAWQRIEPVCEFFQREPDEGKVASFKTEVRIAYDEENLYLGVRCYDKEPERICAKQMERDVEMEGDDTFAVILDTHHDLRNAFYFETNPNGAKFDAYVTDEGHYFNVDWDGVWDVVARIDSLGWTAEMRIPFETLRFKRTEQPVWGVNFRRYIARKNEEDLWCAFSRNEGLFKISKAGELQGIRLTETKSPLSVKPYLLVGVEYTPPESPDFEYDAGLDIKYGLLSSLTLDLTIRPDFAQVEADVKRINLTRFSLFYPEKREFFLEGKGIFSFGSMQRCQAFYSRRIGLSEEGEEIPIVAGAKVTGKVGSIDIGVLNVQTAPKDSSEAENFTVLRLKKEVLRSSYIGWILTNRSSRSRYALTSGIDFLYSTTNFLGNKNLYIDGYFMMSSKDRWRYRREASAYTFSIDYPNDLIDTHIIHSYRGEDFDPEVGFVRRTGVQSYYGHFRIAPRIERHGIKRLSFMVSSFNLYDVEGKVLERSYEFRPLGVVTDAGDFLEVNHQRESEYLDSDFEIFEDVVIPEGWYEARRWEVELETSESRPIAGFLSANTGDFYTGDKQTLELVAKLKATRQIALSGSLTRNWITLPEGKFRTTEVACWLNYNFSTTAFSRLFVQYNSEDKEAILNVRIHLIPKARSHIYLVYDETIETEGHISTVNRVGMIKISYNFNL